MPYTGTDPNLIDLQNQITAIAARLAALDGQGLIDPTLAWTTIQAKKIAGLQSVINQAALALQQQVLDLRTLVTSLQTALNTHLGL